MAGYLLLRNNVKSGPYQLEELINFGLKPYDLVWAEGKSAAWRYGSEIEELKPYAPAVEEQPYDRFFKKKPVSPAEIQPVPEKKTVAPQETPVEKKYEKYIPSKSVFVTLPGQKTAVTEPPATAAATPVIIVTENPAAAQTHQPAKLEEISERYAKTLQQRKTKIARKSFWMTNLKRASVIGSLVMVGVIAGFFIRSGSETDHTLADQAVQPLPVSPVTAANPVPEPEQEPVKENNPAVTATASPADIQRTALVNKMNLQAGMHTPLPQEKQQVQQAGLKREPALLPPSPKEFAAPALLPEVKKNELTGERNRTVRDDDDREKPVPKTNTTAHPIVNPDVSRLVSVASNDYKRVAFGGIRNLELTVTNGSQYRLDKVTVELQYLKPDEQPLRTELIQFRSVGPNGSLTMKIKDTNRGMKISCRIVNVQPLPSETALSAF